MNEQLILKWALKNAVDHDGKAVTGFVVNKVVGEAPELRKDMQSLATQVSKTITQVNKLSVEEQKKKLLVLWPEALEKRVEEKHLPELPNAIVGAVVLRFAPNPSGPMHIGHARQALLNWFYAKKYQGKYVLRFDDTDPKTKPPMAEAYDWFLQDLKWLGVQPDEVHYASDRLPVYYQYAEKLIKLGKGYVCKCALEKMRENRNRGSECECRKQAAEKQFSELQKMLSGEYHEGDAVLRVKTDMKHPNPAMRDWTALKIVDKPNHPRSKAHVWPLLNFNSAIDDHEMSVTHIIRGVDLAFTEPQQKYLYNHFRWDYPETVTTGKILLEGAAKSKTEILAGIKTKKYSGWDDPKLGTLQGLRKAGILPDAVNKLIFDLGVRKNNLTLTWDNVLAAQKWVEKNKFQPQ